MRYSDNIARRKGEERKVSNAPAVVEQRLKFGMLAHLGAVLQPVVEIGFQQRKRGVSARNEFVSVNKEVCTVVDGTVVVDFEHLLCAQGRLIEPDVKVSFDSTGEMFTFLQEEEEEEEGYGCSLDDGEWGVLLECKQGLCRLVRLRARGESGSTTVALPKRWNREDVVVYCFAISADGRKASNSVYMTIEAGN